MPTILFINGWRFYFYANENKEPVHVHIEKAEMEAKYWLHEDIFEIEEAYSYNLSPRDKREVRKILFDNFDYLIEQWNTFRNRK